MVPLLHVQIGIGNNLLDRFCGVVNAFIEKLSMEEIELTRKANAYNSTIHDIVKERNEFDKSSDGTQLKSLKGKIISRRHKLCALPASGHHEGDGDNGNESDASDSDSDNENKNKDGNDTDAGVPHPLQTCTLADEISKLELELKPLVDKRKSIVDRLNVTKRLAAKTQETLSDMQKSKARKGVSLETQIYDVLKKVGVQVQAYHGGSLNGKDIIKVMNNATYLFGEFAKILKKGKRDHCELSDDDIDALCRNFQIVFVLWDGAISYARKKNPEPNDVVQYRRFARAAVDGHVKLGLSVTPKVHLMHKHVEPQMTDITGGMGNKMEDGIERSHQIGGRYRLQFGRVANLQTRAVAKQRYAHRSTNPEVVQQMMQVEEASKRKFTTDRNDRETAEKIRERERMFIRSQTIDDYEADMENNAGTSLTFVSRLLTSIAAAAAAAESTVESTTTSGEPA